MREEQGPYFKIKTTCSEKIEFIKEINLYQKDCEANFTKISEEEYLENKISSEQLLEDESLKSEKLIEFENKIKEINKLSTDIEKITFLEYLSNPNAYSKELENIIKESSTKWSEAYHEIFYTNTPQKELDAIINYLKDKNTDIIIVSRPFKLENELQIDTNYPISLRSNLKEFIKIENNKIINKSKFGALLDFVIKKEDNNITVSIDRG